MKIFQKLQANHNRAKFHKAVSLALAVVVIGGVSYSGIRLLDASHAASGAVLSMAPSTGTYTAGTDLSDLSVAVHESSGTDPVNTVQASLKYDATQLKFISITEGTAFPARSATNTATAGTVMVDRSINQGGTPVSGDNAVVTVNFKILKAGSAQLSFDKAYSFVVRSTDSTDILATTTGATYTLLASQQNQQPTISLSPASGTYAPGSLVAVMVKENGYSSLINTVEPVISYPTSQLQYVSTTEGSVFTEVGRTTDSNGTLDLIRYIPGGSPAVSGENPVVTANFKVIGSGGGTAALAFTSASAIFDNSGTGKNVLDLGNSTGASYAISTPNPTCSANPTAPGAVNRTAFTYTGISLFWSASTAGSGCTLAGYHVYRNGALAGNVTADTSYSDTGLTSGTAYSYTVTAFDSAGHTSDASPAVSLSTKADDQAPTSPLSFSGTATSPSSISLKWNPSSDYPNPGGVGVAGYHVYRNGSSVPTYTTTSGTTVVDNSVSANTHYSYTVTAYDKLGNQSAPSNIVDVTTPPAPVTCTANPSAPSSLAQTNRTLTSIGFSWNASTAATGCTLAGYHVYRGTTLAGTIQSGTTYTDLGLAPNTSYTYTVTAYDTAGHLSPSSTALTAATAADTTPPSAPGNVTAAAISAGQVNLSWHASSDNVGVSGYRLYRNGNLYKSFGTGTLSYSDTLVTGNTDYSYKVSAIDGAGNESAQTAAVPDPVHTPAAQDTTKPSVPANLKLLVATSSTITFSWDASTDNVGVRGYHVYRNGTLITDVTSATSYSDSGLNAATTYNYTVKAYDAAGNISDASATLSAATLQDVQYLIGDLNLDGKVDFKDLSIMLKYWQQVNVPPLKGDLNGDGTVDQYDLSIELKAGEPWKL